MSTLPAAAVDVDPAAGRPAGLKHRSIAWARQSPWRFGAAMVALMFPAKILAAIAMSPLAVASDGFGEGTTAPLVAAGAAAILLSFLFLPVETLLGQALPIGAARLLRVRRWRWPILLSSIVFALLHLPAGVGGLAVGLGGGVPLAWCWLAYRPRSFWYAAGMTTAVHALHNLVAFTLFALAVGSGLV